MKYTRKTPKGKETPDWLCFKPGAMNKPIAQLSAIALDLDQLAKQIESCHFENDGGTFEAVGEGQATVMLTPLQLDWVRECFWSWSRDEALDPEA